MQVREQYKAVQVAADATVTFHGKLLGGFIAKTDGAVTINDHEGNTIVDAFPVTAGNVLPLPLILPGQGGTVIASGGASGILCV